MNNDEITLDPEKMYETSLKAKLIYERAVQNLKDTREDERKQIMKIVQQRNSARDLLLQIRKDTKSKKIISKINKFFGDK